MFSDRGYFCSLGTVCNGLFSLPLGVTGRLSSVIMAISVACVLSVMVCFLFVLVSLVRLSSVIVAISVAYVLSFMICFLFLLVSLVGYDL